MSIIRRKRRHGDIEEGLDSPFVERANERLLPLGIQIPENGQEAAALTAALGGIGGVIYGAAQTVNHGIQHGHVLDESDLESSSILQNFQNYIFRGHQVEGDELPAQRQIDRRGFLLGTGMNQLRYKKKSYTWNGGPVPMMDFMMSMGDARNTPWAEADAEVLNTLEPRCCEDWKFIDRGGIGTVINTGGGTQLWINQVPQGATVSNRVGDTVYNYCFNFKATLQPQSGSTPFNWTRVCIIYDKQPKNTAGVWTSPVWADMFNTAAIGSNDPLCFYNVNNQKRFTVLFDQTFLFGQITTANDPSGGILNCCIPLHNLQTIFSDATPNGVSTGALMLCWNCSAASPNSMIINWTSRVWYGEKPDYSCD